MSKYFICKPHYYEGVEPCHECTLEAYEHKQRNNGKDFIAESADIIKDRMKQKGSGKSKKSPEEVVADVASVHHIADHYAHTCGCGSVHFNLPKSGKVECSNCHHLQWAEWHVR